MHTETYGQSLALCHLSKDSRLKHVDCRNEIQKKRNVCVLVVVPIWARVLVCASMK